MSSDFSADEERYGGWHPLRAFDHLYDDALFIYAMLFVCTAGFLWGTFSKRHRRAPLLHWPLLLALVPFCAFSWSCYSRVYSVPAAIRWNMFMGHIDISGLSSAAAYHYQCGLVVSLSLVAVRLLAYFFFRYVAKA
jgi:hypothetical protein